MSSSAGAVLGTGTPVTAIIPTYNRAEYLGIAIASVLGQSFPPAEVIVVDDGSQDNTREVANSFGPAVEYLKKANGGKSTALNLGLRHATGQLIWIFDDDDIAEPDALRKLVTALQENPGCGFAYGDYDIFTMDKSGRITHTPASLPVKRPENLYLALMERSFILQQGLLVRKLCYDETGRFDESLIRSQDLDMMLRLARRYMGIKVEGIMFHLRQHEGMRGSEASPVLAKRKVEGWVKSDRQIIGQIYATRHLQDFLPNGSCHGELTAGQRFTCLLQRSSILARKGLWNESAQDLLQAGGIAESTGKNRLSEQETGILRRAFDLFSYASHTFESASEFRRALREMKPKPLQREVRAAILWPLPFTIGAALLHGHRANLWRFLQVYFALATPSTVVRTVFTRSFFNAGLELLRSRRSGRHTQSSDTQWATFDSPEGQGERL